MRDRELQARVSRLRQIISEAVPIQPAQAADEADAWKRYQSFAANDPLPAFDVSPRAKMTREINRIATSYGWIPEIQRHLDAEHVSSISALGDESVAILCERMRTLEACVQDGCDPPDVPHAR
jgi:hypothetical protein